MFIKVNRARPLDLPNGNRNFIINHEALPVGKETIADPGSRNIGLIPLFEYQMRGSTYRPFPPSVIPLRTPVTPVQLPLIGVIDSPVLG